jgi:hypothetical protein
MNSSGDITRCLVPSRQGVFNVRTTWPRSASARFGPTLSRRKRIDNTRWIQWFLGDLRLACLNSQGVVRQALARAEFWQRAAQHRVNERQSKILRRLVEAGDGGFFGGMTAEKHCNSSVTSHSSTNLRVKQSDARVVDQQRNPSAPSERSS